LGTAVKKTRFTCLSVRNGEFVSLMATTPGGADKKTGLSSILIIKGTAGDINARRVDCSDGGLPLYRVREELKKGTNCTIIVGDPVKITGATYWGEQEMNNYKFLVFIKNGFWFWLYSRANASIQT